MPFAQVKSDPWKKGAPRRTAGGLWSEREWKWRVLVSLHSVETIGVRLTFAQLCSFRFTKRELFMPLAASGGDRVDLNL